MHIYNIPELIDLSKKESERAFAEDSKVQRIFRAPSTGFRHWEAKVAQVEDKVGVDHQNLPVLTSSTERPRERMWRTR